MPKPIIQVHHRGARGVDGILRLIELAGHDGPIEVMLSAMCDEIAAIAGVDIASIYVREDDRLVMRGNHGFPPAAIGATTLGVGEGITGLVAECMRPVSAEHAAAEASYKHVPGLGEERFPVFVGVPLIGGGSTIGVLVMQRRKKPFATDEVTLAMALGAPATLAIERRRASAVRSARLVGVAHVDGAVLGRAAVVPTVTAFDGAPPAGEADVDRAIVRLREDLGRAIKRLEGAAPAVGGALDRFALALCDARLRERLAAMVARPASGGPRSNAKRCGGTIARPASGGPRSNEERRGGTIDRPGGLRAVAKEYARAPYRVGTSRSEAADHAAEIEELCALLGDPRPLRPGAVWIADRIHTVVAIAAVARGAAALVASDLVAPAAIAIARAARLPVVSDVAGLFGWARPGDLLAVDGAQGVVLVHPAPTDIERLRHARTEQAE